VKQESPFCPNIAATPEGDQVWFTLKDVGKVQVFQAKPPFQVIRVIDTGPITNHVNFARTAQGRFAYVTVGGLNQVKVFRTEGDFALVATIPVGALPHGVWPSGDGTRVYVGLENADAVAAIDTATQRVIATIPGGQAGQAIVYVPDAVPEGDGTQNLKPLGTAREATHLQLGPPDGAVATTVALFEQGLTQVLQAAVTGLEPKKSYVLALSNEPRGTGTLEPLARFDANPAGAAIVDTVGPIRQVVVPSQAAPRRYLVIAPVSGDGSPGTPVQIQRSTESGPPAQGRTPPTRQP
jgi:YVTN family beta-propeller protein